MKKIIAVLLTLTLALSVCGMLVACGDKSKSAPPKTDLELFIESVLETEIYSVTTLITTTNRGSTLTARTTLNENTNTVEYQYLNKLDIDSIDTPWSTTETRTASNGENTIDISALDFSLENFESVPNVYAEVLTATIINPSAFFGTTLTSFETAELTITNDFNELVSIVVTYTTANGSEVTLTATFND